MYLESTQRGQFTLYKKLNVTLHFNFLSIEIQYRRSLFCYCGKTKCKGNQLFPCRCIVLKKKKKCFCIEARLGVVKLLNIILKEVYM